MTALFSTSTLTGTALPCPLGVDRTAPIPDAEVPVTLTGADGSTVLVFNTKTDGLQLLEHMRRTKQWLLIQQDKVMIAVVSATKLLITEYKEEWYTLFMTHVPYYAGGKVLFAPQSLFTSRTLTTALLAVGLAAAVPPLDNASLLTGGVGLQILDWNYPASRLLDTEALTYAYGDSERWIS